MALQNKIKKFNRLFIVAILFAGLLAPIVAQRNVEAYSLPTARQLKMSSSADGSTADGEDVIYSVSFVTNQDGASANVGSLVLEFCAGSPIIGDSCLPPTNFNLNSTTGTLNLALFNQVGITDWTIHGDTTINKLLLTRTPASVNTGVTIQFDLGDGNNNGVHNPENVNTTFFARVVTFTTVEAGQEYQSEDIENEDDIPDYDSGTDNVAVDAGGFALSTAEQITVTAKVPEKLTFCVFTTDDTGVGSEDSCGTAGTPNGDLSGNSIILGDANGVLSELEEFTNTETKFTISTNALSGVAVRIKGGTLKTIPGCPETPGQSCSIDSIDPALTEGSFANAAGTEQFGFCLFEEAGAGLTPEAPYDNGNCSTVVHNSGAGNNSPDDAAVPGTAFGFFNSAALPGTVSTYGDVIAVKTAGTFSTGLLAFLANISITTEPGIYTTTFTFIATGTY